MRKQVVNEVLTILVKQNDLLICNCSRKTLDCYITVVLLAMRVGF